MTAETVRRHPADYIPPRLAVFLVASGCSLKTLPPPMRIEVPLLICRFSVLSLSFFLSITVRGDSEYSDIIQPEVRRVRLPLLV